MVTALDIIGSDSGLQEHWLKRFVALIIDYAIFYVVAAVLTWFVILPFWSAVPLAWSGVMPFFAGVMFFLYSLILEGTGGATLGKKMMDLRVIPISGQMDMGKAAVRNISKIHGLFLLVDWLVGFVSEGDPKQRWLDRVAGTTVVTTAAIGTRQQNIYQSQQAKYAPPPGEDYHSRHDQVYQYPPQTPAGAPVRQPDGQAPQEEATCPACGGRMILTGNGRLQCIRCGKIQ